LAETEKAIGRALREIARGSGFTVVRHALIWREGLVVADLRLWALSETQFRAKPAQWDTVLWDILQLGDHVGKTVSRHWKSNACPVPALDVRKVRASDPTKIAAAIFDHASDRRAAGFAGCPQDFPQMFRQRARDERAWHFVMTEAVSLIAAGSDTAAQDLCEAVIAGTRDSRYSINTPDRLVTDEAGRHPVLPFFEHALRWLERQGRIAPRPRPVPKAGRPEIWL
jgi:hypothetical protein